MEIVFDPRKRLLILDKRGRGLEALGDDFFAKALAGEARDGRRKTVGRLGRKVVMAIHAQLGAETLSIVSMRSARARERKILDAR